MATDDLGTDAAATDSRRMRPLKLALTIDDVFMWPGLALPPPLTPQGTTKQMTDAFGTHGVKDVYAFSCTKPVESDERTLHATLDAWCGAGHHVGGHTHGHCALNWASTDKYIADIDRSHAVIARYLDAAPTKFFRYPFDMWGDKREKTDAVMLHLARTGFSYAPISMWFYDAQFAIAHLRAQASGDLASARRVEDMFVDSVIDQVRDQADGARAALGRDPIHIALLHGTPIGAVTMDRVLGRLRASGVEFVSLETAMRDPANLIVPPLTTRFFRSFTQKWAQVAGVTMHDTPPKILEELKTISPMPGFDEATLFENAFDELAKTVDGTANAEDFYG